MSNSKKQLIITIGSKTYTDRLSAYFQKDNRFILRYISEEAEPGRSKSVNKIYHEIISIIDNEKVNLSAIVSFGRSSVLSGVENIAIAIEKVKNEYGTLQTKIIAPPAQSARIFSNKLKTTLTLNKFSKNTLITTKLTDKNIFKIMVMIDMDKFPMPAVLKATNLTGGAGIVLITCSKELILEYSKLKEKGIKELILTEYCVGPETSVEILCLGDKQFIYPMALKESTNESLVHADNKIKISGYVNNIPHLDQEVLALCRKYKIQGYFSVEGIIYDSIANKWKIMEGMTRFTGNHPLVNGSNTSFDSMEAIYKFICNEPYFPASSDKFRVVIQLPIFKQKKMYNIKNLIDNLGNPKWILLKRLDYSGGLPYLTEERDRIQITFIAGTESELDERIDYLRTKLKDETIRTRIKTFISYLNNRFPQMINKKYYAK